MKIKIAILGWGSLLWEGGHDFDLWHEPWQYDGPSIKLEFSRVSKSRSGALTLIIDPENGSLTTVAYCLSKRTDPEDAICDLLSREGTTRTYIGYVFLADGRSQCCDKGFYDAIIAWAQDKQIDAVIWTSLPSNFSCKTKQPFSVAAAISYLKTLGVAGKAKAAEYVWRAPHFVQTPLRKALQSEPWFTPSNYHRVP